MTGPATLSERSAWIRRGWEDQRKGWKREEADVPARWWAAYLLGWRRARVEG